MGGDTRVDVQTCPGRPVPTCSARDYEPRELDQLPSTVNTSRLSTSVGPAVLEQAEIGFPLDTPSTTSPHSRFCHYGADLLEDTGTISLFHTYRSSQHRTKHGHVAAPQ